MAAEEVTVDKKGRVQIPKAIRDKVGLRVGGVDSDFGRLEEVKKVNRQAKGRVACRWL
jgi:bifunctional DNA-binding transcriptional regulator/antitoxin component of YhaV-PrlF toxin-antitoxin module